FYTLRDVKERGFEPLAFRYATLMSHYRSKMNFTWEALEASQNALNNLRFEIAKLKMFAAEAGSPDAENKFRFAFSEAVNNDLNVPEALGVAWQAVKDDSLSPKQKLRLLLDFDKIFGLGLENVKKPVIPRKIKAVVKERELLRANKQFIQSDALRNKIEALGYKLEDTENGPIVIKKPK
ncbi:MAG: hypothetical protein WC390_12480, partial [Sulfurimonas sp.]